jgi:hypothetical protein
MKSVLISVGDWAGDLLSGVDDCGPEFNLCCPSTVLLPCGGWYAMMLICAIFIFS